VATRTRTKSHEHSTAAIWVVSLFCYLTSRSYRQIKALFDLRFFRCTWAGVSTHSSEPASNSQHDRRTFRNHSKQYSRIKTLTAFAEWGETQTWEMIGEGFMAEVLEKWLLGFQTKLNVGGNGDVQSLLGVCGRRRVFSYGDLFWCAFCQKPYLTRIFHFSLGRFAATMRL
jgi:hypothetical protein